MYTFMKEKVINAIPPMCNGQNLTLNIIQYFKYQGMNNQTGGSFSVQSHLAWIEMIILIQIFILRMAWLQFPLFLAKVDLKPIR